ncbi:MAG: hypothetical protein DRG78_04185 [Epsilonproteobacteria bacterium]|nr:MAG: hypothetical protein DRG78_04185 [Campylobacterota bacterium]
MKNYIKTISIIIGVVLATFIHGCSAPTSNNKKLFNNSVALLCATSTYRYGEQVLVTTKSGWSLYEKDFFKKGDRIVYIQSCKTISDAKL